jgi:hypothetical protein
MKPNLNKPYTLESFKAGKKAVFRNGTCPDEIFFFETVDHHPIRSAHKGIIEAHTEKGMVYVYGSKDDKDLFEPFDEVTKWYNVYYKANSKSFICGNPVYDSEADAKKVVLASCVIIDTRSITYTIE